MPKLSNSKLLQVITKLLVLILLAKLFSLALWWYLPSSGVDHQEQNAYVQGYNRIDFKNMLVRSNVVVAEQKSASRSSAASIGTIILQGLYGNSQSGFAIVAKKSAPDKTSVIGIGDVYEGYTLKTIQAASVIFVRNNKEYILKMDVSKKPDTKKYVQVDDTAQESHSVGKADINYYQNNPQKIWKDIAINEVFEGKNIKGFRVDRIKKNSKIAELGLQKGDVIIRANNVELTSYKSVMDLYKKINSIDVLELVVLRNNQEKEIIYEIH